MRFLVTCLMFCMITSLMVGCQAVQDRTNKEAPNQIKQMEGRKEINKSGGEKNKKESKEGEVTE